MSDGHSFGFAVGAMQVGRLVRRAGWNGKGMHLQLVRNGRFWNGDVELPLDPFIAMYTVQGTFVPWLASQTDVLATDWQLIPAEAGP